MAYLETNGTPQLRQRAEARRQGTPAHPLPPTPDELHQLLQELQLHQVELEIQNEELLIAQTEAETSRAQYAELYQTAPVGYCTLDGMGKLLRLNHSACQLLSYPASELLDRRLAAFVETDDLELLTSLLRRLRKAPGQHSSVELALRQPDGIPSLQVQVEGVFQQRQTELNPEPGYHLVLLDVSVRHAARIALAASEARFRATFEQSRDGMALLENQHFLAANNAALRLLGLREPAQLLGRPLAEYWPATQPNGRATAEVLRDCLGSAETVGWCRLELLRYAPTGEPVWDELSFNPVLLQGQALVHTAWRDITARKRTEAQLRQSETRLRQALDAARTGVWSLDLTTHTVHPDARAQEIFGLGAGLPFGLLQATVHPDDVATMEAALANAAREHRAFDLEHRLLRADGTVRHVAATGSFDYDPATGQPHHLHGLVRDITDRRQAETERDYKDRLLRSLLHNVPVLLARIGLDGCFREHAGTPLRRIGLADNELAGQLATEVFPESAAYIRRMLAGEPVNYTVALHRDSRVVHLQVHGFFDADSQEAILFGSDITEAEHLKEEAARLRLRQQQELHAVILNTQEEERRRIAESLHNGVGQLLYATRLHLDQLPPSEELGAGKKLLNEAIRDTRTVSFELTPPVLNDFGLPAALRELARRIPAGSLVIELDFQGLEAALPQPLQIAVYRAVQELLNNVIKHAQAREVFVSVAREGDQLYVSVEDDGQGFEPEQPAAAGIGLASIRGRVELLGGTFEVRSRLGKGSNFFLQLPVRG